MIAPSYRRIWHLAWPIMVSLVMEHMINLTDTAFLGRVGEVELGASALAGVYYMAIFMLGFGFSTGAQILMARRNGEGRIEAVGPVLIQGILFLVGLAAVMIVLTILFSPGVLGGLIASEHVAKAALDYMNWRIYGLLFAFVGFMFRAFFVAITSTSILTVNSLVMVGSNVVLNYLLIFGEFGFPRLGIAGAAIASSLAELVSMLFFIVYVRRRIDLDAYGLRLRRFLDLPLIRHILGISIWTMLEYFVGVAIWFLFFIAVEHLGERAIAISNIVRSVSTLLLMPVSAFAAATTTLVSNLIGAGAAHLVPAACRKTILMSYLCLLPPLAFLVFFPSLVVRLYTDVPALLTGTTPSLLVMATSQLVAIPGCILFNAVSGTGNTRAAMYMDGVVFAIYAAYCYVIVVHFKLNVAVCWTTEHAYWLPLLLFSWLYMKKADWRNKKI